MTEQKTSSTWQNETGGRWSSSPARAAKCPWVSWPARLNGYYVEEANLLRLTLILLICLAIEIFLSSWWEMLSHCHRAHPWSSGPPVSLPEAKEAIHLLTILVIKPSGVSFSVTFAECHLRRPQVRWSLLVSLSPALCKLFQKDKSKHLVRVTSQV